MSVILQNLPTIIICLLLAAVVAAIIIKLVRDKKAGRHSCGCGCGSCPNSAACHGKNSDKK